MVSSAPLSEGGRCHFPSASRSTAAATSREVEPRLLLVHFLRDALALTGTKIGCDTSQCGACTVLLDGVAVKSCTLSRGAGRRPAVTTIEGLAPDGSSTDPGSVLGEARAAVRLLHAGNDPRRRTNCSRRIRSRRAEEIRHGLEGNLCRCTGYQNIVRAVQAAAATMGSRLPSGGRSRRPRRPARVFGSGIRRREDPRLHHRAARYTADMTLPGIVHAAILRSPHGHARIRRIDTAAAPRPRRVSWLSSPALIRKASLQTIPCAWLVPNSDLKTAPYPPLAKRRCSVRRRRRRGRRGRIASAGRRCR